MGVPKRTTLWIFEFLTRRPQFVYVRSDDDFHVSSTIVTNTGAPQGTVLAPVLFSIYTETAEVLLIIFQLLNMLMIHLFKL